MSASAERARRAFEGRAVAITGGAGGIGTALARRLLDAGARVGLLDLDAEALTEQAAGLGAGHDVLAVPTDVTDLESCRAAIERVVARWGGVDTLVNNAGITHLSLFRDTDPAVIRRVVDVNLFGAVNATSAALPWLTERQGRIVTVSSVAGVAPLASRTGYAASKHALHGLFDSLRAEVKDSGVSVTIVCPQFVAHTGIGDRALGGDGGAPRIPRTTTGRAVEPDEVAAAIVDAAAKRRRLLLFPRDAKVSYLVARAAPALYERMMAKRILRGIDP